MKKIKGLWVYLMIVLGLTLFLTSNCKKNKDDGSNQGPPVSNLTADKSNVSTYEIASLTPTNISVKQNEYYGIIAGETVNIFLSENKLCFIIPDISPGPQTLTTAIEGNTYSVNYTVNKLPDITDPVAYVNQMINQLNLEADAVSIRIDTLAKYGLVNSNDEKHIVNTIKDSLTLYKQKFILLSGQDQVKVVKILSANLTDLNSVMDSLSPLAIEMYGQGFKAKYVSCNQPERAGRMLCLMTRYNRIQKTIDLIGEMNNLLGILTFPFPDWAKLPLDILTYSIARAADQYFLLGFELGSRPYHPLEISFNNPPASFINFEPKSFSLAIKVRNSKEKPDDTDKYWEKEFSTNLKNQINSWHTSLFDLFSGNYSIRAFPLLIQPQLLSESIDLLSAHITSNTNVFDFPVSGATNDLYLKFGTNLTATQNFTYNLEYNDYVFSLETVNVQAILAGVEPYSIAKVTGDNQTGQLGQILANPIVVIVNDQAGNPFNGALVHFTANNGGSVTQSQVTTGTDGKASVSWTLGGTDITQTLTVTAFKSDNTTPLQGSPLTFTASTTGTGMPCPGMPTITDSRDGQVYPTVQIGSQCWLQKNMNYNTGTSYCYDNNTTNCNTYGRLYERQTALGACPSGWHLPSNDEWTALADFLGGVSIAGGKMKEAGTAHWYSPNTGATNSSGFTALPGGVEGVSGDYGLLFVQTRIWSSTEVPGQDIGWGWIIDGNGTYICLTGSGYDSFSVRCLKD